MVKNTTQMATKLLAALLLLSSLSACGTMAGAGQDISKAGNALENSADKHAN